ncbi:MAG: hypothetical protein GKR89_36035 [Candidatus Latescibacteria bacterium]|nr:hypothetical protein [Candidatus Latescibacterota bacterium]
MHNAIICFCFLALLASHAVDAQSNGRLVFSSDRAGAPEIYVVDVDGGNLVQLTTDSGVQIAPPATATSLAWSPDGRQLAFVSNRGGTLSIFIMNQDGTNLRLLTENPAEIGTPSWSPDGRRLAFTSAGPDNQEIYLIDADGSNLINWTNHQANDHSPAWSPTGSQLAFVSNRSGNDEIYLMNVEGATQRYFDKNGNELTQQRYQRLLPPFRGEIVGSDPELTRLTDDPGRDSSPAWSPDGSRLAFASNRTGDDEIYTLNPENIERLYYDKDGTLISEESYNTLLAVFKGEVVTMAGELLNITNHPADDGSPAWSPEGDRLAFTSTRADQGDIFVVGADGSGTTNITDHPAGDGSPAWAPVNDITAITGTSWGRLKTRAP